MYLCRQNILSEGQLCSDPGLGNEVSGQRRENPCSHEGYIIWRQNQKFKVNVIADKGRPLEAEWSPEGNGLMEGA